MNSVPQLVTDFSKIVGGLGLIQAPDHLQMTTYGASLPIFQDISDIFDRKDVEAIEVANITSVTPIRNALIALNSRSFNVYYFKNEIHLIDGERFEWKLNKWFNENQHCPEDHRKYIVSLLSSAFYSNCEQLDLNDLYVSRLPEEAIQLMTKLRTLSCRRNPNLECFHAERLNHLTSLSLSDLPALREIRVNSNPSLNSVSLANLPALQKFGARDNSSLESLSFEGLPKLYGIEVNKNSNLKNLFFERLIALQMVLARHNPMLESLSFADLPALRIVEVAYNQSLSSLLCKSLPSLKKITAQYNSNLETLSFERLRAVEWINISNNDRLTSLSFADLPALREIWVNSNPSLNSVSLAQLPALQKFGARDNSSLESLSFEDLPKLYGIEVDNNSNLKNLFFERLIALQIVLARQNPMLESLSLSDLPALRIIEVAYSQSLRSLLCENLPSLKEITAQYNSNLETLSFERLPAVERINISNNDRLTSLIFEDLSALEQIYASSNPSLRNISLNECVRVRHVDYTGCSQDVILNGVFPNENNVYEVSIIDLEENPLKVLQGLYAFLEIGEYPSIQFLDHENKASIAVDRGGVRRALQTLLFKNLFSTGKNRVRFHTGVERFHLPKANLSNTNEIEYCKAIGHMLYFAYTQRLITGSIFPTEFFSAMTSIPSALLKNVDENQQEINEAIFLGLHRDSYTFLQDYLKKNRMNTLGQDTSDSTEASNEEKLRTYIGEENISPQAVETVFKSEISTAPMCEIIFAISVITQVLYGKFRERKWEEIRRAGPEALQQKIQGSVDLEDLLQRIDWNIIEDSQISEIDMESTQALNGIDSSDPRIISTVDMLENYLKRPLDPEFLQKFLFVITGSSALIPNEKITVRLVEPKSPEILPEAHTCSLTLYLPVTYENQDIFNAKLDLFLKYAPAGTGFSLA